MVNTSLKPPSTRLVMAVGVGLSGTWEDCSNPAGALCELTCLFCGNSHSDAVFNFCPDVTRLAPIYLRAGKSTVCYVY